MTRSTPVTRRVMAKAIEWKLNSEPRSLKLTAGQIAYMRRMWRTG